MTWAASWRISSSAFRSRSVRIGNLGAVRERAAEVTQLAVDADRQRGLARPADRRRGIGAAGAIVKLQRRAVRHFTVIFIAAPRPMLRDASHPRR